MKEVLRLVLLLKKEKILLWLEGEKIKIKSPIGKKLSDEYKEAVKNNKEKIIEILSSNKIYTETDFFQKEILAIPSDDIHTLSYAQKRLLFLELSGSGSYVYNLPLLFLIPEYLDKTILAISIHEIVKRHEVLRGIFVKDASDNYSHIISQETLKIIDKNFDDKTKLEAELHRDINYIFQLSEEIPIKVIFYNTNEKNYLLINVHHVAFDGSSYELFLKELMVFYHHYKKNITLNLPNLDIQYKDFSLWQTLLMENNVFAEQANYWRKKLENFEMLNLNYDKQRPELMDRLGSYVNFHLHSSLTRRLEELAKKCKTTLYSVLLSSFYVLLNKYSHQDDIVIGTPISNRHYEQLENLIGFFVNSSALRTKLNLDQDFTSLVSRVHQTVIEAQIHQDFPFEHLLNLLDVPRTLNQHPIFQIMFMFQNFGQEFHEQEDFLISQSIQSYHQVAKFDLTVMMRRYKDEIRGHFNYASCLFNKETIQRMLTHFQQLLINILDHPHCKISDLSMLTDVERNTLLVEWNQTEGQYPQATIHALFETQVERTPNAVAMVYEEQAITYAELNTRANQVAHYLRSEGVGTQPDMLVALGADRSLEFIIGILAVLKAGAAYVPLDSNSPTERLRHMLEDAQIKFLLTQTHLREKWQEVLSKMKNTNNEFCSLVYLDQKELFQHQNNLNPVKRGNPSDLVYVIYTSGSTGKQKGVLVEHRQLVNYVSGIVSTKNLQDFNHFTAFSTLSADLCYTALFVGLLSGKTFFLPNESQVHDPELAKNFILRHHINFIKTVPSYFSAVLASVLPEVPNEICLFLGGEIFSAALASRLLKTGKVKLLVNHYGPTETTVGCFTYNLFDFPSNFINIPIGRPLPNSHAYVMSNSKQLVPVGVVGELYIGGAGLSRGYLNRPELNAERFIEHRFGDNAVPIRLYRTGDLVRYLPDGNVVYMGRTDNQIKIRGFRVELEEIEAQLLKLPRIQNAVVVVREEQPENKQLIAYFVSREILNTLELKAQLKAFLSDYMIPSHMMQLEKMPFNTNGKIDRNALPELNRAMLPTRGYREVETPTENRLVALWLSVLFKDGSLVQSIGLNDNFFDLGGDSLLIMNLVSKIRKEWRVNVEIRPIYDAASLQAMAHVIDSSLGQVLSIPVLYKQARPEKIPLSFSQQRLWFLENLMPDKALYHIPLVLKLKGKCDISALCKAYTAMIERHESLRTRFEFVAGKPYQVIDNAAKIPGLMILDVSSLPQALKPYLEEAILIPFNLSQGPLIWGKLIILGEDEFILCVTMHHIITDGVSTPIYWRELSEFYRYYTVGGPVLAALDVQYVDYTLWQQSWLQAEVLQEQINYWKEQLKDIPYALTLPTDYARPNVLTHAGGKIRFRLDKAITADLKTFAAEHKATLFMVMLSALQIVLHRYSGQKTIVVGSPIANRRAEQMQSLIGFFVNTLALKAEFNERLTVTELLKQVKTATLGAYAHQDIPFEELVRHLDVPRQLNMNPVFQVMLAYRHAQEQENLGELQTSIEVIEYPVAKFDLTMNVQSQGEELKCSIEYSKDSFKEATIKRFVDHFTRTVNVLAKQKDTCVDLLPMLSEAEVQQQLVDWNQTVYPYPKATIHELFEAQVKRTPNAVALVYEEQVMTYAELNARANQMAHYLRTKGIGTQPDMLVGLGVERSFEMMIGILAILKAGGAYVPLDSNHPDERLRYMLEDAKVSILLTQIHLAEKWKILVEKNEEKQSSCLILSLDDRRLYIAFPEKNLISVSQPQDLIYVLYTSGSTGKPKGVMIEHAGIVNRLLWMQKEYSLTEEDTILQKTPYSFDVSVWELFWPIIIGSTLCFAKPEGHKDPVYLQKIIKQQHVTTIHFVPSMLKVFLNSANSNLQNDLCSIQRIFCSGEGLPTELIRQHFLLLPNIPIYNLYGPTEASIDVSYWDCRNETQCLVQPIGKPIDNIQLFVLDANFQLVPLGVSGELYIGGIGLARGYLNPSELMRKRFIEHCFSEDSEPIRLYRTGDLVRYLPDGNIEYIGRTDNQIKIRGFRVELEEIKAQILKQSNISDAVVIVREDEIGNKQLIAYFVSSEIVNILELKKQLRIFLPDYMIPSHMMQLENIALNINGKVDSKMLPSIDKQMLMSQKYLAPQTEIEMQLVSLWAGILNISEKQISVMDNFYDLGGDSLSLIRMLFLAKEKLFLHIDMTHFFSDPTIRRMISVSNTHEIDWEKEFALTSTIPTAAGSKGDRDVLITGVTGHLGIHIMRKFLTLTEKRLYLIVRARNDEEARERVLLRYKNVFSEECDLDRVTIYSGDISQEQFGLTAEKFMELMESVSMVIHTAAAVNHVFGYEKLKNDNVVATLNIIKFSQQAKCSKLLHISTQFPRVNLPEFYLPQNAIQDFHIGYLQSKFMAEQMLASAVEKGCQISTFRIPLIIDIDDNTLLRHNHFILLVVKCFMMRCYPKINITFDVCLTKEIALIFSLLGEQIETGIFNAFYNAVSLKEIFDYMQANSQLTLTEVDYVHWKDMLASSIKGPEDPFHHLLLIYNVFDASLSKPSVREVVFTSYSSLVERIKKGREGDEDLNSKENFCRFLLTFCHEQLQKLPVNLRSNIYDLFIDYSFKIEVSNEELMIEFNELAPPKNNQELLEKTKQAFEEWLSNYDEIYPAEEQKDLQKYRWRVGGRNVFFVKQVREVLHTIVSDEGKHAKGESSCLIM